MRLQSNRALELFNTAQSDGLIEELDTTIIFYDLDILEQRLKTVRSAFGPSYKHSVAIKSNPLSKVLEYISKNENGLEAASFEELCLANNQEPSFTVWDSPVKTKAEIIEAEKMGGVLINADSLDELELILAHTAQSKIGLRINPQVNTGSHGSMSVSGQYSKFGEPIANRASIIEAILRHPKRITALHVHSSSQTTDYDRLCNAIRSVVDLANEINQVSAAQIETIDIGGGFPVSYEAARDFDIAGYAEKLKETCPELWNGTYQGITEFGRYYHANAGFTATRIEGSKGDSENQTIITHAGADLFLREAYNPGVWPHEYSVIRAGNEVKQTLIRTDIGGPLCFGGDYIQKEVLLPKCQQGDWLFVLDTGANSFALWSRHCSRSFPKVIGFDGKAQIFKKRESIESIIGFWS